VAIGLAVGWLIAEALRRIEDPMVKIVLSVVTGYAAYLPADRLGLSGVLAAVAAGLYVGWRAPQLVSPATRLLGASFWEVLVYLLNALPLETSTGQAFPQRNLIIFITFGVILATLVLQGLSLPWLTRRLGCSATPAKSRRSCGAPARHRRGAGPAGGARRRGVDPRRHRRADAGAGPVPPPAPQGSRRRPGRRRRRGPLAGLPAAGPRAAGGPAPRDLDLEDARLEI
jgi:hypothetical protein